MTKRVVIGSVTVLALTGIVAGVHHLGVVKLGMNALPSPKYILESVRRHLLLNRNILVSLSFVCIVGIAVASVIHLIRRGRERQSQTNKEELQPTTDQSEKGQTSDLAEFSLDNRSIPLNCVTVPINLITFPIGSTSSVIINAATITNPEISKESKLDKAARKASEVISRSYSKNITPLKTNNNKIYAIKKNSPESTSSEKIVVYFKQGKYDEMTTLWEVLFFEFTQQFNYFSGMFVPTRMFSADSKDRKSYKGAIQKYQKGSTLHDVIAENRVDQISRQEVIKATVAIGFFGMFDAHSNNMIVTPKGRIKFFDNARSMPLSNGFIFWGDKFISTTRSGLLALRASTVSFTDDEKKGIINFLNEALNLIENGVIDTYFQANQKRLARLPPNWVNQYQMLSEMKWRIGSALKGLQEGKAKCLMDLTFAFNPRHKFVCILTAMYLVENQTIPQLLALSGYYDIVEMVRKLEKRGYNVLNIFKHLEDSNKHVLSILDEGCSNVFKPQILTEKDLHDNNKLLEILSRYSVVDNKDQPEYCRGVISFYSEVKSVGIKSDRLRFIEGPQDLTESLLEAVRCGCADVVSSLVREGANLNVTNPIGTVLHQAIRNFWNDPDRYLELIRYLLSEDVDFNAVNAHHQTALHCAVLGNHKEIVTELLRKDANIEIKDKAGRTAIEYAKAFPEIENLLQNKVFVIRFIDACKEGDVDTIKDLLTQGMNPNSVYDQRPLLFHAVYDGQKEIVKILIGAEADVHAVEDFTGDNAVHMVVAIADLSNYCKLKEHLSDSDIEEILDMLIQAGADVNRGNIAGITPLHRAVFLENKKIVEILLRAGAFLNARTEDGRTALHIVLSECENDVNGIGLLEYFLKETNIDVNAVTLENETALHYAALCGYSQEIIQMFLDRGADPTILNDEGKNAADLAKDFPEIQALLQKAIAAMVNNSSTLFSADLSDY